jgi:hypothetical protein
MIDRCRARRLYDALGEPAEILIAKRRRGNLATTFAAMKGPCTTDIYRKQAVLVTLHREGLVSPIRTMFAVLYKLESILFCREASARNPCSRLSYSENTMAVAPAQCLVHE